MPRVIKFVELDLHNFAGLQRQTVTYGDITHLSGRNGQGKTTIGTAPIWVLWGTDLYGKKYDPRPTTYKYDIVRASLIISIDDTQYKFTREIDSKSNKFYFNDIPTPAKEYEATVANLLDQDEFMTLYFPAYFFGLHWTKQRELIMRRMVPPAKQSVLKALSEVQATKLDELIKKHSLDDLEKLHRDRKNKLDKAYIAAQSRTNTLREQLMLTDTPSKVDGTEAEDIAKLDAEIAKLREQIEHAEEINREFLSISKEIDLLTIQIDRGKRDYTEASETVIATHCNTCGQELTPEARERAEKLKAATVKAIADKVNPLILKRKELREKVMQMEYIDISQKTEELRRMTEARQAIQDAVKAYQRYMQLQEQVKKAEVDEIKTHQDLNESIFILDAIKSYRAKEAEIQAEKVQSLFKRLSVRLFKYIKTDNRYDPDFSIQMDGKDYVQLSTGEKMAAGMELAEVLFEQADIITPMFLDGIGEYTGRIAVYGQLITGRAVPDQDLLIETKESSL